MLSLLLLGAVAASVGNGQSLKAAAPAPAPSSQLGAALSSRLPGECAAVVPSTTQAVNLFPLASQITAGTPNTANSINISVAQDFTVQYMNNYKIVNNSLANELYVLYQCGTPQPQASQFPAGTKFFSIPLTAVSLTEDVPYAYLDLLGVTDRLQSTSAYTVNACGQLRVLCNQTAPFLSGGAADSATLAKLTPLVDAVVGSSAVQNPKTFAFSATQDPGPLNRLEWIKFMGLFFNKDATAEQVFNSTATTYNASAARFSRGTGIGYQAPTVAWINNYTLGSTAAYEVSFAPYKVKYTQDAGGQVPVQSNLAAMPYVKPASYDYKYTLWFTWGSDGAFANQSAAAAAFHQFLSTVDVVVDETYALDPTKYNMTTFLAAYNISATAAQSYPFLKNKLVFREDGLASYSPSAGYGLDWFEGALVHPDVVLTDVVRAVQPSALPQNYTATWLRNIAAGENVTIATPFSCASAQTVAPGQLLAPGTATTSYQAQTNTSATSFVCPAVAPSASMVPICAYAQPCSGGTAAPLVGSQGSCQFAACAASA